MVQSLVTAFIVLFASFAHAQAPAAGAGPSGIMQFVPIIFMFVVFYFFIIRPQVKKQKDHQTFVASLEKGSEVVTNSGILGTIEGLTDKFVTLEIAPNVRIRVLRGAIASSSKSVTATNEVKS